MVYDYKEYLDVKYGRCDNCDYTLFKSSVKSRIFLRECRLMLFSLPNLLLYQPHIL
ncbi:hypothetical protein ABS751_22085 [Bacillus subtilis]